MVHIQFIQTLQMLTPCWRSRQQLDLQSLSVDGPDLCEGVAACRPAVGLFDQLAVHLVLQLGVGQAHLQSILGQRRVVIHRRRLDQNVDEELAGLKEACRYFSPAEGDRDTE